MHRRESLAVAAGAVAGGAMGPMGGTGEGVAAAVAARIDAAFHASRHFARTALGRIAYVERGAGSAALFLHGLPLNGFQWRGALERLSPHRRWIAPDSMGLGYTEVPEGRRLEPEAQASMLAAPLDALAIRVDLVASDSGGAIAQLFVARYLERVRTLLLTKAASRCPIRSLLIQPE